MKCSGKLEPSAAVGTQGSDYVCLVKASASDFWLFFVVVLTNSMDW